MDCIPNIADIRIIGNVHGMQCNNDPLSIKQIYDDGIVDSEDILAFQTKFSDELVKAGTVKKLVTDGEKHNVSLQDEATEEEKQNLANQKQCYNQAVVDLMRPEIMKLKEILEYTSKASSLLTESISIIIELKTRGKYVPVLTLDSILYLLDVLIRLDSIKDQKSCLNNDFARYKRALGLLSQQPGMFLTADVIEDQTNIQNFLSSQDHRKSKNFITVTLRDDIKNISGNEDILSSILEYAVDSFEKGYYFLPQEKFRLLRCFPHLMFLLDGNSQELKSYNVFKNKKLIASLQRIFKAFPIVPLYGDIQMSMIHVLERLPHYSSDNMRSLWVDDSPGNVPEDYNLSVKWAIFHESFSDYSVNFTSVINLLKSKPFEKEHNEANIELADRVNGVVTDGIVRLSSWNAFILQVLAWKLSHPFVAAEAAHDSELRSSTKSMKTSLAASDAQKSNRLGVEYERALRSNFTEAELSMFVEILFIIKALASMLTDNACILDPVLQYHVYCTVQELVQPQLLPVLHRAHKRSKKALLSEVLVIRFLAADRADRPSLLTDFVSYSRKSVKADISVLCPLSARFVAVTHTQWQLLRTHIQALCDEKSIATTRQGLFSGKVDLEPDDVATLENFCAKSRGYPYVLELQNSIRAASDLSDLWYREFFLEISRAVQFPMELSMPWILFEHILKRQSKEASLIEKTVTVLEVYNDAANRAINVLQLQHVFDEIEAEASLFLDQCLFSLSEAVYAYFKEFTASNSVDYSFKLRMEELKKKPFLSTGKQLFDSLLSQHNIKFLGRSIDLNFHIGQHVNNKLQRDVDAALQIFESGDITALPEVKVYIDLLKQTHTRLSKYLAIDPFDSIFHEANESFAPTAFCGRIAIHVLRSLISDIFPNYSYNLHTQRFVPSPVPLRPTLPVRSLSLSTKHLPPSASASMKHAVFGHELSRAYEATGRRTRGFFSRTHMEAYIALCSTDDIPLLIEQCIEYMILKVREVHAFYEALSDGILPCKLPKFMYKTGGVYASFEVLLQPLVQYEGLKADVFQCFREIGNVIMFLRDLSDTLAVWSALQYFQCNAIFNTKRVVAKNVLEDFPIDPDYEPLSPFGQVLQDFFNRHAGTSSESEIASVLVETTRKVIDCSAVQLKSDVGKNSLLVYTLACIQETLHSFDIKSSLSHASNMFVAGSEALEIQDPKEFHRFLSALNFIFCMPDDLGSPDEAYRSDLDEYGHGFIVCGCALLHLLGQRSRYQLLDFSSHVLNVHAHESNAVKQSDAVGSVDSYLQQAADSFVRSARQHRLLFTELMCLFEATYHLQEPTLTRTTFHPPSDDLDAALTPGFHSDVSVRISDDTSAAGAGGTAEVSLPTQSTTSEGPGVVVGPGSSDFVNDDAGDVPVSTPPRRGYFDPSPGRDSVASASMSEITDADIPPWTGYE